MQFLVVFDDGTTTLIRGNNMEFALGFGTLSGHDPNDVIAAFKVDTDYDMLTSFTKHVNSMTDDEVRESIRKAEELTSGLE